MGAVADGAPVLLPPKLKNGFGVSALAAVESVVAAGAAPNKDCCGCVVGVAAPPPKMPLAVLAGLDPKRVPALPVAGAAVKEEVLPNRLAAGLGPSAVVTFPGSVGLAPNRVDEVDSAGLLT